MSSFFMYDSHQNKHQASFHVKASSMHCNSKAFLLDNRNNKIQLIIKQS